MATRAAAPTTPRTRRASAAAEPPKNAVAQVARLDLDILPTLVGYFLRRLQQAYKEHFFRSTEGLELSLKDVAALLIVGRNPGVTPSQLGAGMAMDGTMTSLLLAALERRELVVRKTADEDRRSRTVHLTEKGRALIPKLRRQIAKLDAEYTGSLSDSERALLLGLLARVWAVHAGEPVSGSSDDGV